MRLTIFFVFMITFIIGLSFGCQAKPNYHPGVELSEVNGEPMLLGKIAYEDILYYFPEWKKSDEASTVADSLVEQFRRVDHPLKLLIFVGTWCSDSHEGVPPFMKIIKAAKNPNLTVEIIGVDRDLLDPENLAPEYGVERVPTFVILKDNQEIGRLEELPIKSFAEDFIDLLGEYVE